MIHFTIGISSEIRRDEFSLFYQPKCSIITYFCAVTEEKDRNQGKITEVLSVYLEGVTQCSRARSTSSIYVEEVTHNFHVLRLLPRRLASLLSYVAHWQLSARTSLTRMPIATPSDRIDVLSYFRSCSPTQLGSQCHMTL